VSDTSTVSVRHNRETGTEIHVWDLDAPDAEIEREVSAEAWDDDGNVTRWAKGDRWATFCNDHGTFCTHRTRKLAESHAAVPSGWCEDCAEIVEEAA
jgi:hypothetical protein